MARPLGQSIEIEASSRILRELEAELAVAGSHVRKAGVRAIKKTLRAGKTQASREIRDYVNLKKKAVDKRITIRVVSERALVGRLTVRDRRVPLVEFLTPAARLKFYQHNITHNRRIRGVRLKAYRRKPSAVYPGTFVTRGRRDRQWHVLKRYDRERDTAVIQYGPRITEEFEKALGGFAERANAVLQRNLEHELNFALGRI